MKGWPDGRFPVGSMLPTAPAMPAASRTLGLPDDSIALQVTRRYFDRSPNLIEFTVSTHPPGGLVVNSTMRRVRA